VRRSGLSLLELLACITIIGIVAAVVLPRLGNSSKDCNSECCRVHKATIEVQAVLWKRQFGNWPAADLSDIGRSTKNFPEGLPVCPVDGSPYSLNSSGRVVGHLHK
jgi:general secretion pathway protein G